MALGKKFGSAKKARASFKKGSGSSEFLWRLKADEQFPVRFLQEPEDWFRAAQHYVGGEFVWCTDPEKFKKCEHCAGGDRPAMRALANVLDRETGKVRILQMTKQLADSVVGKVDRPVTTADYEIWREGSSKDDTKYGADRMDSSKCDISRYKLHDIEAALIAELGFDPDEDDDEDEEEEPRSTRSKPSSRSSSRPRRRSAEPDDEDEDDVDGEDEEEEDERPRRSKKSNTRPARRSRHVDEDEEEDDEDVEDEEDDEDERPSRPRRSSSTPKRPVKKSRSREDGYDEFKPEKSRHPEAVRTRKLRRS